MIVQVEDGDFAHARQTCPEDAPTWMVQEFAANHALRRAFPTAEIIRVTRYWLEVDGTRFHRSLQLYTRRGPYRFKLGRNKLQVRLFDLMSLLSRG